MSFGNKKFKSYDPYATYSNIDNLRFISLNGEPVDKNDYAISFLFETGRLAFSNIYQSYLCSRDEFEEDCSAYYDFLLGGIPSLKQQMETEGFECIDAVSRQPVTPDLDNLTESDLIRFLLHHWTKRVSIGLYEKSEALLVVDTLFLHVLHLIDDATSPRN